MHGYLLQGCWSYRTALTSQGQWTHTMMGYGVASTNISNHPRCTSVAKMLGTTSGSNMQKHHTPHVRALLCDFKFARRAAQTSPASTCRHVMGEFLRVFLRTGGATSTFDMACWPTYFGGLLCYLIDARGPKRAHQAHHPSQAQVVQLCDRFSWAIATVQMALEEDATYYLSPALLRRCLMPTKPRPG